MSSILSVYLDADVTHDRPGDIDYIRALQPAWVRIHQVTARRIWQVQAAAPNATLLLRSWDLDDHNDDRKRELYADPKGAARNIIEGWRTKRAQLEAELRRNGWGFDARRWVLGLWNEPDNEHLPQLVEATAEAMRLTEDERLGVGIPGVGRFPKPDEPGPSWNLFRPLEKPIRDGGHILAVHEYWQPEGPSFVWTDGEGRQRQDAGSLAWRHHAIPLDVPILVGEAGANGYIYGRHAQQDDGGWQKYRDDPALRLTPERYAAQVREYIAGCDQRVQGVCLFITDFHSDQWWSFDTGPAHEQLLAIKDVRPGKPSPFAKPATPPHKVTLPIVQEGPPVATKPDPMLPQPRALVWPCKGIITQRFGERVDYYLSAFGAHGHNGLDIGAATGTPVQAVAAGVVAWVGTDKDYGNYVRLYHAALGCHSFYAHLETALVQTGQQVQGGQQIGTMGNTGNSSGPHLHLEIRLGAQDSYGQAAWGHTKGRIDPETAFGLLGTI